MYKSDKIVWSLSLILIALVIAGFVYLNRSTSIDSEKSYKVTVIIKSTSSSIDFWKSVEEGVKTASEEFNIDYKIEGTLSETMVDEQIDMMNRTIAEKPDAILLASNDYKLLAPSAKKAVASGITLIAIDSDVDFGGKTSFVATDNKKIGEKLGELLDRRIGTASKYMIVEQVAGTKTAVDRVGGVQSAVKNSKQRLIGVFNCDSSTETAKKIAMEELRKNPEVKGIVATNEVAALGVAEAVKQMKLAGKISVVACDSSIELIKYMEEGIIQEFVVQRPFNMGYMGIKFASESLRHQQVPVAYDTGSVEVNIRNMYESENQKLLFPFNSK